MSNLPDFEIIARLAAEQLSTRVAPDAEVATYGQAVAITYRETPADLRVTSHRRDGCVVSIVASSVVGPDDCRPAVVVPGACDTP